MDIEIVDWRSRSDAGATRPGLFRWPVLVLKALGFEGLDDGRSKASSLTVCSRFGTLSFDFQTEAGQNHDQIRTRPKDRGQQHRIFITATLSALSTQILDEIIRAMKDGDRVELRGFGAFSVKSRSARTGRNPRTGSAVEVTPSACPSSRPARNCASG